MIPLLALTLAAPPELDLSRAVVVAPPNLGRVEANAVRVLVEEVAKRSHVRWGWSEVIPPAGPVVLVGPATEVRARLASLGMKADTEQRPAGRAEGYHIGTAGRVVWVAGNDARGVLFGVGRLLRELRIGRDRVTLPNNFAERSAPTTPLRGHQLGYRPKTNSYDGWTVAMWEQYLRDLIVFGCNAVELIPPRSDDAADSPHFPLPPLRMMAEVSRLAGEYGLDVWVWFPALDKDYADPKTVAFALKEWGEVFAALPRVDAVFVPGGDPGRTPPRLLLGLLEKQTANLKTHHPAATMWVSPQSFTAAWFDEFLLLLKAEPAWLAGVVYGPEVRVDLPEFRKLVPARYPVRDYPDLTHSRHCQYPVPDWDLALSVTHGREASNPRPRAMAGIVRRNRPHTAGFLAYSEGCHDDVNKAVWSAVGWNPDGDVAEVLRQYARYFVGPAAADRFAAGLLGLEQNWVGPVLANDGIDRTLELFQALEREATPDQKRNWRFQQALYRAYFDAFVRARLRHETDAENEARARLRQADTLGSADALAAAEAALSRPLPAPAVALRTRVGELAEALFQSARVQLSVPKYQALAVERGANLDTVDHPLTEAGWLRQQLAAVCGQPDEPTRLARLGAVLHRTDPGPGGFYDDLGDPLRQPHLVRGPGPDADPGFYRSALTGFGFRGAGPDPAHPRAWWHHAEPLYDRPLALRYAGLDPAARYRVRVVYARERRPSKVRLVANGRHEVHGYTGTVFEPLEFPVPPAATAGGGLTLEWTQDPGGAGTGRGCQVAEVFLLRGSP